MSRFAPVVVALLLAACSAKQAPPAGAPPVRVAATPNTAKEPAAARTPIAAGAVVIGVRTPAEFAERHLPQAVNIPVQDLAARAGEVATLAGGDRARPVVVSGASGNRARGAVTTLSAAGHTDVVNGDGFDDLQ